MPLNKDCPKPDPTDPSLPSVDLKVVYWCKGEVFTSDGRLDLTHYQIKLRPRIVNNTSSPITIAITKPSAVRLLVTGKQVGERWTPPPRTAQAGDRPTLVQCNGRTFWAIPPNVPRDATRAGESGYYTGFATTWDGTELGPGQSYFHPLRHDQRGKPVQESDLVFQVPLDDEAATIYGLAVLETKPGGALLGVAPFTDWGPPVEPSTF
ncbi:hypothetical protein AB0F15_34075 [Amycolatopsis sp. NPDC026612]|uniref:hypothetical protein n=1 Tax=Amycolatopsis sp. NPDC026612 TaxID=3155466 RepID=UPI0033D86C2E